MVDAAVLQYQNQKLVQQLDAQKHKLHDLEAKMKELRDKQASYDDFLVTLNQIWNQARSAADQISAELGSSRLFWSENNSLIISKHLGSIPSCPAEEIFLCRVLKTNEIPGNANDGSIRIKTENFAHLLEGKSSAEGWEPGKKDLDIVLLFSLPLCSLTSLLVLAAFGIYFVTIKIDVMMKEEANYLHGVIDALHLKHKEYADAIEACNQSQSVDRSEIKRLEALTIVYDVMEKDGIWGRKQFQVQLMGVCHLKGHRPNKKILKEDRLSELQDAQEDNLHLLKQLQDLQADRSFIGRREKELVVKSEAVDAAKKAVDNSESRIEELEHRMHRFIIEKNELEIKMEEAIQDSGRKDIKEEFQIMGSALSKEIGMMEAQLNRWKEIPRSCFT
ncbi:hypothetical protein HAX54_018357 [Datura stramonium]|uniref:E3 ubiquitin protein ligase n=1 Tax=Datura stramonium TaxID=4076 RepID=A0ABS8UQ03_DATST|nr:hypothetical protein [Datura stramonium]